MMKSHRLTCPFVPKSTAALIPGQFWALPLSDGSFGCGRVIQLAPAGMRGARVTFLAAVLDWVSRSRPTSAAIAGAPCVSQGRVHIKAVTETGGEILGHRPLELDGIAPWLFRGSDYWRNSSVQEGLIPIRPQTPADDELPVFSTWGYKFAWGIAEDRFVTKTGLRTDEN
jgi:hypothetical protein